MSEKEVNRMVVVPDDFAGVDSIGYSEHSDGLVEMIRSVKANGSFTIGVFGQWGQGKTSMLRQIEKQLSDTSGEGPILTAWFNPWQFSGEEHIIIPFFHTLVSYLQEYENNETWKKVKGSLTNFLKELVKVPMALAYGFEGAIKIPLILESKFKFKDIIDEARRSRKEIEINKKTETDKLVETYESMYYRLISKLQGAAIELQQKVVVFIDDLDRCLPEKAVRLLEGIKVFLDIPGFVFVIGVSREVVERGIRVRYHELYKDAPGKSIFMEQDYLDKIIQFPFTLPPPDQGRLHEMIEAYLEDLEEVKPYLSTIHKSLGENPRCLKRFINNLSYTFWVAGRKGRNGENHEFLPELLVKISLIAFRFPGLYQLLGRNPKHLCEIQDYLKYRQSKEKQVESVPGKETPGADAPVKPVKDPNESIDINELKLLEWPNLEVISSILSFEKRQIKGVSVEDLGFTDENRVRNYCSLLVVTRAPEKPVEPSGNVYLDTMKSRLVYIQPGKILLKDEGFGNEYTAEISAFLLDKYPLTQDIYFKVTGKRPSEFKGDDHPVESVTWLEVVDFCNRLSEKSGLDPVYTIRGDVVTCDWESRGFRLPTEAEWEYACRAGTNDDHYGEIDNIAWYKENSGGTTHEVGQKVANKWGLHDMLGNVWEWCWDWYGRYPGGTQKDYRGSDNGSDRVLRGGSWSDTAGRCRAFYRLYDRPGVRYAFLGFRLARSL